MTATVTFNFTITCGSGVTCHLDFEDGGYFASTYYFGANRIITVDLIPDDSDPDRDGGPFHALKWTFYKQDPNGVSRTARAIINSITISGTNTGGASKCVGCLAGSYVPPLGVQCLQCGVGSSSANNSASCTQCPANTFNDRVGGPCIDCGAGTTSVIGSSDCYTDCTYTARVSTGNYTYDLLPLRHIDEMYGPIFDSRNMEYYINVCSRQHHNHTCFDGAGNAIESYACQITTLGYGVDLGRVIGFYPHPVDPANGLVISYTHGSRACGNTAQGIPPVERASNITFNCDPSAGVGTPIGGNPLEGPSCFYNFIWNSTYGCPLCTANDYATTVTECLNGFQTQVYFWRTNPKRCHDGVTLPASQTISCSVSTVACLPGQYQMTGTQNCTDCPAGFYSIGGGIRFDTWTTRVPGFTSGCYGDSGCTGWISSNRSIDSSIFGSSWLNYTKIFTQAGYVTFDFRVVPDIEINTHFVFRIDGVDILQVSKLLLNYTTYTSSILLQGYHTFSWEFVQPLRSIYSPHASIRSITFNGTDLSSSFCSPCPPGTFSSNRRSTGCQTCTANMYSGIANTYCTNCPENTYSLPGSDDCEEIVDCTMDDYNLVYTPCSPSLTRNGTWVKVPNVNCKVLSLPNVYNVECAPCQDGTFRDSTGQCITCSNPSQYYDSEKGCQSTVAGSWAQKIKRYFIDDTLNTLPSGFTTGCSGSCGDYGWRPRGSYIDSGDHSYEIHGSVDTFLQFNVNLIAPGKVAFFSQTPTQIDQSIRMEFWVDGYPTGVSDGDSEYALSAGAHTLLWNVHLPSGHRGIALLRNIDVYSTTDGAAFAAPCPAGTKSTITGATQCTPCAPGTFSDTGASSCTLCPRNFYAYANGSSSCYPCGTDTYTDAQVKLSGNF